VGQKERRLKQQRERDRARCAAQSVQVRLHKKSATKHKRQAAETPDHREARLEGLRAAQQERLAAEKGRRQTIHGHTYSMARAIGARFHLSMPVTHHMD